jgi:hypothetical protein
LENNKRIELNSLTERPGSWGLWPSAALAALSRQREQTRYPGCRAIRPIRIWGEQPEGVRASRAGLTNWLPRLGLRDKRIRPGAAAAGRQAASGAEQLPPLLALAAARPSGGASTADFPGQKLLLSPRW